MATAEAPPHRALPAHLSQEKPGLWSMPGFAEATALWIRLPWLVQTDGEAELKQPTVCSLKLWATSGTEVGCGKAPDPEYPKFKRTFKPNVYFIANSCHLIRSNQKLGTECPAPPLTAQN